MPQTPLMAAGRALSCLAAPLLLSACTGIGSLMSPYSEKFSCKNDDHGQCIHPDKAYADAVAGAAPRSDPDVTNDKALLAGSARRSPPKNSAGAYSGYRDSVYREMQGLIDAPETPMLRDGHTVRTLIMPYVSRERPDRLYMQRFVYSILERPQWVVGDYLVTLPAPQREPVLEQKKLPAPADDATDGNGGPLPVLPQEARP